MHNLKSIPHRLLNRTKKVFSGVSIEHLVNIFTILVFSIGVIALAVLVWLYIRPIPTADIKVPVATDQASYSPGEPVSGIFFGDTYYTGEVRILREVFCKNYKGVIKPPAESAIGNFFSTQAKPRHLEGQSVVIGNLPADIPVGLNCVLQFTNVYEVQTPFGIRHLEYQYYTQNFAIVTKERRQQLDCEASGSKTCNFTNQGAQTNETGAQAPAVVQSSPETAQPSNSTVNNSTTNNTTNTTNPTTVNEPAPRTVEQCTVNLLGIKINCHQVPVD